MSYSSSDQKVINDKKFNEFSGIIEMLLELNTDEITPKQALDIIDATVSRIKTIH